MYQRDFIYIFCYGCSTETKHGVKSINNDTYVVCCDRCGSLMAMKFSKLEFKNFNES